MSVPGDAIYRAERAALSTPVLVFLASCVLTASAFVGAFLVNTVAIGHLQEAGFYPSGAPSTLSSITDFIDVLNTPSENIWYRYIPGRSIAFAFPYNPLPQAIGAALGIMLAGLSALVLMARAGAHPLHPKNGALIMMCLGVFYGCAPLTHSTPEQFSFDLTTSQVTSDGETISLAQPMTIYIHTTQSRRGGSHSSLYARNALGNEVELASGDWNLLGFLSQNVQNFVNQNGGAI
jgi:hypothetical protein